MRYPLIERTNANRNGVKWGINTNTFLPYQKEILYNNALLQERSENDQFLQVLFKIKYTETKNKSRYKIVPNYFKQKPTHMDEVIESAQITDWTCAICRTAIKSIISYFKRENFLCKKCKKVHMKGNVDGRILDSSLEFRKHCVNILEWDRRYFLRYIEKNIK